MRAGRERGEGEGEPSGSCLPALHDLPIDPPGSKRAEQGLHGLPIHGVPLHQKPDERVIEQFLQSRLGAVHEILFSLIADRRQRKSSGDLFILRYLQDNNVIPDEAVYNSSIVDMRKVSSRRPDL